MIHNKDGDYYSGNAFSVLRHILYTFLMYIQLIPPDGPGEGVHL